MSDVQNESTGSPDLEITRESIDKLSSAYQQIHGEMSKVIVGQDDVIEQLLIALFSRGHCLLEGVPGLAKTLMISSLAQTLSMSFSRIQFTPDLMPADITGTDVLQENRETGEREFRFIPGPLFHNMVLADEINRTPPKTQAALLEAMQEHQVSVGQTRHLLSDPFFVLATQNPIEMDGTYRLPEAQIDRFLFKSVVTYPSETELQGILGLATGVRPPPVEQVLTAEDILTAQDLVRQVPIASHVQRAIARLAIATQPHLPTTSDEIRRYFRIGLSPRGAQALVLAAKAHALLMGRYNVSFDDVSAVLVPTLRHRLQLNFEGEAAGVNVPGVLERLLHDQRKRAV